MNLQILSCFLSNDYFQHFCFGRVLVGSNSNTEKVVLPRSRTIFNNETWY